MDLFLFVGFSLVVISVNIPDGAAMRGPSIESYGAELTRKGVIGGRSIAEILAPFREQVAGSERKRAGLHLNPCLTGSSWLKSSFENSDHFLVMVPRLLKSLCRDEQSSQLL